MRGRRAAWRAAAAPELPDLDALLGGLDLPEIDADLASLQTEQGAVFDVSGAAASQHGHVQPSNLEHAPSGGGDVCTPP